MSAGNLNKQIEPTQTELVSHVHDALTTLSNVSDRVLLPEIFFCCCCFILSIAAFNDESNYFCQLQNHIFSFNTYCILYGSYVVSP